MDGAIAISEIYYQLADAMKHIEKAEPLSQSGVIGVGWASSGGEASALLMTTAYLACRWYGKYDPDIGRFGRRKDSRT